MKKQILLPAILLILLFSLTACGKNQSNLTEGDCPGVIAFTNIPKEFSLLDDDFMDQFYITVLLENIANEKDYRIILNQENNFRYELSLHPGTYRVLNVYANQVPNLGIQFQSSEEAMNFAPDRQAILTVNVIDPEALTQRWTEIQPLPEILLADKYSGMIQINRKVIPIQNILSELDLNSSTDTVAAFQKLTVTDSQKGVQVNLLNPTGEALALTSCTVTGITVTDNSVLFPDGITHGTPTEKACHRTNGLYGEPTRIIGTLLYGWDLATSSAIYSDPVTGNRITLTIHPTGSYIKSITYELALFE